MKTPDFPSNEENRLKTLKSLNILDTPQEERFDRLTRMAKRLFDVPIALVSLVDENRQWFKSSAGPVGMTETPRDISFCGHAILGSEIFVIPDATKDDRFKDNPLLLDSPNIRFYAGFPLRALDGSRLGTLCIIDQQPREFNQHDVEALTDLASMAEEELAAMHLALIDDLTSISNRRGFMMLTQHAINLCVRQKTPASLVALDLNKFKQINDRYGHAEGDRALVSFASLTKNTLRESDLLARVGGDEFLIFLTGTSQEMAETLITKLQEALKKYNLDENRGYVISFSHGIVDFNPMHHHTIEQLIADGDSLMYQHKRINA